MSVDKVMSRLSILTGHHHLHRAAAVEKRNLEACHIGLNGRDNHVESSALLQPEIGEAVGLCQLAVELHVARLIARVDAGRVDGQDGIIYIK